MLTYSKHGGCGRGWCSKHERHVCLKIGEFGICLCEDELKCESRDEKDVGMWKRRRSSRGTRVRLYTRGFKVGHVVLDVIVAES